MLNWCKLYRLEGKYSSVRKHSGIHSDVDNDGDLDVDDCSVLNRTVQIREITGRIRKIKKKLGS